MTIFLRTETAADHAAIHAVHCAAFGTPAEALLVDTLRQQASPLISLVALHENAVTGHLMASPVTIDVRPELRLMGIAPVAIQPAHQRKGLGSALIEACIAQCRALDMAGIVVLGHPGYYPRFGFQPASGFGIRCEYDVPDEAFMLLPLQTVVLAGIQQGTARYHSAFADLE